MPDILRVFKSLADPTRLRIVRLLLQQDLCVCELMFVLEMAQSRVSHQLRILRDASLVEDVRDGQWIIYRLPDNVRTTIAPFSPFSKRIKNPPGQFMRTAGGFPLAGKKEFERKDVPLSSPSNRRRKKSRRRRKSDPPATLFRRSS